MTNALLDFDAGRHEAHGPVPEQILKPAFDEEQFQAAQRLLAAQVISMGGRKLEEGDWSKVYCQAKGIPEQTWSNLNIDVQHKSLGVEHKMLCTRDASPFSLRGTRKMHPAATRSLRIDPNETDANRVMESVLRQYGDLIQARRALLEETPDLRTGWLLWKLDLTEFLYFEEETLAPDPGDFTAKWNTIERTGSRKASTNLWIYEKATDVKRYSLTTSAGIKLQPYFDIPPVEQELVYEFALSGQPAGEDSVHVWVSGTTHAALERQFGSDREALSEAILNAKGIGPPGASPPVQEAERVQLTREAYQVLCEEFPGATDDERLQTVVDLSRD